MIPKDKGPIGRELILYYGNIPGNGELLLQKIMAQMGVRSRKIEDHELTQPVGYLAGMDFPPAPDSPCDTRPEETVVVMQGMSDARIKSFLTKLSEEKLRIELKAVVTKRNQAWPFMELVRELRREHAAMKVYHSFQNAVKKAENWLAAHEHTFAGHEGKKKQAEELKNVLKEAKGIMLRARNTGEIDLAQLKESGETIADLIDLLAESEPV